MDRSSLENPQNPGVMRVIEKGHRDITHESIRDREREKTRRHGSKEKGGMRVSIR